MGYPRRRYWGGLGSVIGGMWAIWRMRGEIGQYMGIIPKVHISTYTYNMRRLVIEVNASKMELKC